MPERLAADDAAILRPHEGITAAGGNLDVVGGSVACSRDDMIDIAYLGPDLSRLDEIGLEELVIEEPSLLIDAYVEALNTLGGVHGRCIRASAYLWDPADAAGSVGQICDELVASEPLFVLNFLGNVDGINCATLDGGIVTLGLYASAPSELTSPAEGRLFLDDGTHAYLLENSIEVALRAGHLSPDAQLGFLRGAGSGSDDQIAVMRALMAPGGLLSLIDKYGMNVGSVGHVPAAYSEWSTLLPEQQIGALSPAMYPRGCAMTEGCAQMLRDGLSPDDRAALNAVRAELDPEMLNRLDRIETFYIDVAAEYRDAGVEVLVSTASWIEVRRLMRAAELVRWNPWWVASDTQGATLTLIGAPENQARRFVLISARRAAGDEVPALDRGCVLLRNTAAGEVPFSHRHHTDAWSVITATCDLLDVAFSALSRTPAQFDADEFASAMHQTDYQTAYGGRITYGPEDPSGADRFRVLQADPDCVLDDWGCMRALTEWLAPVAEARISAE